MSKYWNGSNPKCDIANSHNLHGVFYDARLPGYGGQWALLCGNCFINNDAKTGLGLGQKYRKQDDGKWLCVTNGD